MLNHVLAALIVLSAGIIPQITGFGVAALSMSLLPFVLPITIVIPLVAIMSTIATGIVAMRSQFRGISRYVLPLVVGSGLGVALGMYMLPMMSEQLLQILLGIFLTAYALLGFFGNETRMQLTHLHKSVVGIIAGFFSAFFNIQGPLVGLYVSESSNQKKNEVKGIISTYMFITGLFTVIGHALAGRITSTIMEFVIFLLPFLCIGLWIGAKIYARISIRRVRLGIFVLVFVAGISLLVR